MRALSPHTNYSLQVFEGNEQIVMDARGYAQTVTLAKPVIADFDQGGLLDHEIEEALMHFNFAGLPEGVNPLTRISVFDTEAYVLTKPVAGRDELLVQIDARLRELQHLHPSQFIIVDPPVSPKPWPSYDTDSVEDILKFQERLQVNPELIRKYEEEHENRPEIIEAMRLAEDPSYVPLEPDEIPGEPIEVEA